MYVPPRPNAQDDPLFAARMATMVALSFALVPLVQPALPPLLVALPAGLMAGMRKSFDPAKAFGGPIAFLATTWIVSTLVILFQPLQLVLVLIVGLLYFLGFYLVQKTGNPFGMLLLVITALMSIMGMNSVEAMRLMRDGFTEACIVAAILIPVVYAVFPPISRERLVEDHVPSRGPHALSALIRSVVLLGVSLWLYTVIDLSNIILAIAPVFVLVFPTRETFLAEAWERSFATILGAAMAGLVLFGVRISAHFDLLLGYVFLAALFLASRMMRGRHSSMVYQFSLSVMLALTAGALSTSEPGYAAMTRVLLTLVGAVGAAYATALRSLASSKGPKVSPSDPFGLEACPAKTCRSSSTRVTKATGKSSTWRSWSVRWPNYSSAMRARRPLPQHADAGGPLRNDLGLNHGSGLSNELERASRRSTRYPAATERSGIVTVAASVDRKPANPAYHLAACRLLATASVKRTDRKPPVSPVPIELGQSATQFRHPSLFSKIPKADGVLWGGSLMLND
jgi:hypothetical protein